VALPALPEPENGMVVRFNYRCAGEFTAVKDRPACIALVRGVPDPRHDPLDGPQQILKQIVYLPISSRPPQPDRTALEFPAIIASRLGFKHSRCWVIVSECNVQYWPNDVTRIPDSGGQWAYGFVPPGFFKKIRDTFRQEIVRRKANILNVHYLAPRR
jgi:hypothetical protein